MAVHQLNISGVSIAEHIHADVQVYADDLINLDDVIRVLEAYQEQTDVAQIAQECADELCLRLQCSSVAVHIISERDGMRIEYRVERESSAEESLNPVQRTATIAMSSSLPNAADILRSAIVAIDGIPGTSIEGISPLYHVMDPRETQTNSAVIQVATNMTVQQLESTLQAIHAAHEGALQCTVIAIENPSRVEREELAQHSTQAHSAAVLLPWIDLEPDGEYDSDPLVFLLAQAPDAPFVGMQSDHWIIGGLQ